MVINCLKRNAKMVTFNKKFKKIKVQHWGVTNEQVLSFFSLCVFTWSATSLRAAPYFMGFPMLLINFKILLAQLLAICYKAPRLQL